MSLDPYFKTPRVNPHLIKRTKKTDPTFEDPKDDNKKKKSFSETFADLLDEEEDEN